MKYDVYSKIEVTDDFAIFDFISSGKNGDILKRDVDEDNEINDYAITDNGDRNKVLATVAAIVEAYTKRFPDRWIIFRGSTVERTRLYRIAVGLHLDELFLLYDIMGYVDDKIVHLLKT